MTETFSTFTIRPKRYYILQGVTFATIAFFIVTRITDLNVLKKHEPFLIVGFAAALIAIFANMILTVSGHMYTVDGELTLASESIVIKSTSILLSDAKRIKIKADDYKWARASDGSGNRIEVYVDDNTYTCQFIIGSKVQRNSLRQIIKEWESNGVIVDVVLF